MVTSVTKDGTQKLPQKILRLSKPTHMTIHWKALEHFTLNANSIRIPYTGFRNSN
jgi:hypothetical protein